MQWSPTKVPELQRGFKRLYLCVQTKRQAENVGSYDTRDAYSTILTPSSATDHNHDMAQLLRQIRVGVGTIQQKKIDELLASVYELRRFHSRTSLLTASRLPTTSPMPPRRWRKAQNRSHHPRTMMVKQTSRPRLGQTTSSIPWMKICSTVNSLEQPGS